MHAAGMRRVPAERARHAKRLGHENQQGAILAALGSSTTTQGPSSQTTATSTAHTESSSAPAPPSTTSSSSSSKPSSTASTSTTSSSPSVVSTNALPPTPPSSSSSASTPLVVLTPTLPTSSSTPPPTPQAHAGAAQNSGLSGGAIAGIIAGGAVVGAALIVFIIRKTYLRRRQRQRISWTGAPGLGSGTVDEPKGFSDVTERRASLSSAANVPQRNVPPSPFVVPHGQSMYTTPASPLAHVQPPPITYGVPLPPPATYNNPTPVAAFPTHPTSLAYGPGNPLVAGPGTGRPVSSVRAQHAPMEATVRCAFVPTLPDELSITTGERVFVLERYDDGWDLCSNARGERGMVPRECLEQAPTDQPDAGWRNAGRASSLNPDGGRY